MLDLFLLQSRWYVSPTFFNLKVTISIHFQTFSRYISRGHMRQLYVGKYEVSLEKVAFFRVTDFPSGKFT